MDPLGIALIILLGAIGLIHLAWALGFCWPGPDGVSRAAYVVGTQVFAYARGIPFYTLNRRYYAPICLLLAAGLIADFPLGIQRFVQPQ